MICNVYCTLYSNVYCTLYHSCKFRSPIFLAFSRCIFSNFSTFCAANSYTLKRTPSLYSYCRKSISNRTYICRRLRGLSCISDRLRHQLGPPSPSEVFIAQLVTSIPFSVASTNCEPIYLPSNSYLSSFFCLPLLLYLSDGPKVSWKLSKPIFLNLYYCQLSSRSCRAANSLEAGLIEERQ